MIIGLFGLDFGSSNLGCAALSYSFLSILRNICARNPEKTVIIAFTQEGATLEKDATAGFEDFKLVEYHFKKPKTVKYLIECIDRCDYVFDFTAGDSFSDIYGIRRLAKNAFVKSLIIKRGKKLILGPQTYGPFQKQLSKIWAKRIIAQSTLVFARDALSEEYARSLSGKQIIPSVDVAFALPYAMQPKFSEDDHRLHVGINVSGLLWNGGYTRSNQFGLNLDYRKYCIDTVSWLLSKNYCVHLVGHVLSENMPIEDDLLACEELNQLEGYSCTVSPRFSGPSEAKTYIARLDCFIGARMHATIGALSSGCPVLPVAYSRKFNGLYQTIDYPVLIDAKKLTTELALEETKNYISQLEVIKEYTMHSKRIAEERIDVFSKEVAGLLMERNI